MIEFSAIKSSLLTVVDLYTSKGLLTDAFKNEFVELFNRNTLRIGVIGKMKAGKSSLVNAILFGDRILPTGDKPVTVTLTEITYDEKNGVEVELMSEDDIAKLRELSNSGVEDAKTSAAKEIITSIDAIPGGYKQYVSRGVADIPLTQLQDYVSADGKLSGLAKNVRIKINNKHLQGISIVDTPGFNDPISSRGEITKNAIKDCQILLFVHDYFDRYDDEEVAMATEQIEYAGVSEVIDIVNKTDQESDALLSDWDYLAEDYKKNRQEVLATASPILRELVLNSPVICVSALMSLLGKIEDNCYDDYDIRKYNSFRERYEELVNKDCFHKYSQISLVEKEINRITRNSSRYLLEAPLLKLQAELSSLLLTMQSSIDEKQREYDMLDASTSKYIADVNEINNLIDSVMDVLQETNFFSMELQKVINSSRDEILYKRSETIQNEFVDEKFPEPGPLTTGVKKQNLSNYCTILLQMDGRIRVVLDSLKKSLVASSNMFVENLIAETLTSTKVNVTDNNREKVEVPLKTMIENAISRINLIVETERPTSFPVGKMTQKALYLDKFQTQYNDSRLEDDFFATFESETTHIVEDFEIKGAQALGKLKSELIKGLNYTPSEKEEQKRKLGEELLLQKAHKENVEGVCSTLNQIYQKYQEMEVYGSSADKDFKILEFHQLINSMETIINKYDNVESN